MVKKTFYLAILIALLVSCKKNYIFTKDNGHVVFENFSDTLINVSKCDFNQFKSIKIKSFCLDNISKEEYSRKLENKTFNKLFIIQENSFNKFYNNNPDELDFKNIKEDTTNNRVMFYPFGKLCVIDSVISYIVIKQSKVSFNSDYNEDLIIYNGKNGRLCSLVLLVFKVYGIEGVSYSRSLLIQNRFFEQIKEEIGIGLTNETIKSLNLDEELLNPKKYKTYIFSQYRIDKDGFVKLLR
jgi:hypothetical protein